MEYDVVILTMPYLKTLKFLNFFGKILKLIFHKQSSYPKKYVLTIEENYLTRQLSLKFTYPFRTTCKQLCWMFYWFISKAKQSFQTTSGKFGCFKFLFWLPQLLLSETKSVLFKFSTSSSLTNLYIDYGRKYVLIYSFKDLY